MKCGQSFVVQKKIDTSKFIHVPVLSPSWDLFKHYMDLRNAGNWNQATFASDYVPIFLKEMQAPGAQRMLNHLIQQHKAGKSIALVCFCTDETLCHRSILAGLLQDKGITVHGVKKDYRAYAHM